MIRTSLRFALAAGLIGAAPLTAKDDAPKLSDKFRAAAMPLQTTLGNDKGKELDAAAGATLKQQLAAVVGAASTPDDKFYAGQFSIQAGTDLKDEALQAQGIHLMLDSGKSSADQIGKLHYYLASFAYKANDNATATAELKTAIADGYTTGDAYTMLAETQFSTNQNADGLATLEKAIVAQKASGQPVPEDWYRRGLSVAYKAKMPLETATFGGALASSYPTAINWQTAIETVRGAATLTPGEELDLMRLMARTNSFQETNEYLIALVDADAHRLPGEANSIIKAGLAAGKLRPGIDSVADAQAAINQHMAADQASLPHAYEQAKGPSATTAYILGAADAFLSYGEAAKAAELYALALTKPGVNADLANTRLGIALSDSGDQAGAQAAFAKVTGVRAPIAKLWIAYAQSKSVAK